MNFLFMGLDLSLRATGIVVIREGSPEPDIVLARTVGFLLNETASDQARQLRRWKIADAIDGVLRELEAGGHGVCAGIGVEGLAFSRAGKSNSVTELAALQGTVTALLYERRKALPFILSASEARKQAFGKNVAKKDVASLLQDKRNQLKDADQMDAYVIAVGTWRKIKPDVHHAISSARRRRSWNGAD